MRNSPGWFGGWASLRKTGYMTTATRVQAHEPWQLAWCLWLLAVCVWALSSCLVARPALPRLPPTYDATCQPSHTEYLDLARDRQDRLQPTEIVANPQVMRDYCLAEATERGFLVVTKHAKDPTAAWSTTVASTVWLTANWAELDVATQSGIACHELVHVKQELRLGASFGVLWPTAHGRFALEVPGYSEDLAVAEAQAQDVRPSARLKTWNDLADTIERAPTKDAARFVDSYKLAGLPISSMPRECAIRWAEQIWAEG